MIPKQKQARQRCDWKNRRRGTPGGGGTTLCQNTGEMSYMEPLILLCSTVALTGLFRLWSDKRSRLPTAAVAVWLLLSWPPVDWLLSRPLVARYPVQPFRTSASPQAIVVLASTLYPPDYERPYALLSADQFSRDELAVWLHKNWRPLPVLVCGGGSPGVEPMSVIIGRYLQRAGVPASAIWTEEQSQNTHQNAAFGARILRQHQVRSIVLIVDAQSMLRATACFRKEGMEVSPAPSSFREFGPISRELLPSWRAIERNEATLHETAGLAWYWLRGWI